MAFFTHVQPCASTTSSHRKRMDGFHYCSTLTYPNPFTAINFRLYRHPDGLQINHEFTLDKVPPTVQILHTACNINTARVTFNRKRNQTFLFLQIQDQTQHYQVLIFDATGHVTEKHVLPAIEGNSCAIKYLDAKLWIFSYRTRMQPANITAYQIFIYTFDLISYEFKHFHSFVNENLVAGTSFLRLIPSHIQNRMYVQYSKSLLIIDAQQLEFTTTDFNSSLVAVTGDGHESIFWTTDAADRNNLVVSRSDGQELLRCPLADAYLRDYYFDYQANCLYITNQCNYSILVIPNLYPSIFYATFNLPLDFKEQAEFLFLLRLVDDSFTLLANELLFLILELMYAKYPWKTDFCL